MMMMMIMGRRCEDCGNQAKKECVYMRCRTCCKSKAFHCQTHIKSTWVPAYRRSHKHQFQTQPQTLQSPLSTAPSSGVKIHTSSSSTAHLRAELTSLADFRCVKVSSIHDGKEQYAYQTTVNIGGHVFRGILHDQGLEKVMVLDHHNHHHNHHGPELLVHPSTSSCPLMITSPFTDFMSATQFSSHQKSS